MSVMNAQLRAAIEQVQRPIEQASGMPNASYTSDELFNFERDHVLGKTWSALCFTRELPEHGYLKPIDFMGLPLLVVRDKKGELNVYHNVCSHRGMELVAQEGPAKTVIQCRYHSWCYGLDGELKATPHIGGVDQHESSGFTREGKQLKPVRCAEWLGMVMINLSGDAPPFDEFIAPLDKRWESFVGQNGLDNLRSVDDHGSMQLDVKCNWKLAIENYCEAYHLPWVHPALNSYSPLSEHYNLIINDYASGQGSSNYTLSQAQGTTLPTFAHWPQDKTTTAEYVSLYPNMMLGIQVDHVFAIILTPKAANHTHENLQLLFVGDDSTKPAYAACRAAVLEAWREVFSEDIFAIESMQKGRQSPAFTGGSFSPTLDAASHHFHQWMARQYLAS